MENVRRFGIISRQSPEWRDYYRKRESIERVFCSFKATRRLECHYIRGLNKVRLHCLMSVLAYMTTLLANKQAGLVGKEARWMLERVA